MSGEGGGPRPAPTRAGPPEGALSVFASDEQAGHPVDTARWVRLAERVLEAEGVRGGAELALHFVDEAAMAALNRRFMDEDAPTDVLAFPIDGGADLDAVPDPGSTGPRRRTAEPTDVPLLLGDVVICPAVAGRNAADHAGSHADELALLVVHGILHLLGRDHADHDQAAAMQARERELLVRFHRS